MVNNQNDHENKDILFHSLSTLWLEETKMKVKESTHVKYTNLLKWYINPQLGSYFLSELNYTVCSRFCMQLLSCFGKNGDGLSEKTASDVLSAVKSIVKYATKIGYTPDISIFSVSVRVQQKPIRVFSLNEEKRLVNQLDPIKSRYDCGILLCLFTGLRIGELCALKQGDISLDDCTIHIHKTVQRIQCDGKQTKTKISVDTPKSFNSVRIIPIPPYLQRYLKKSVPDDAFFLSGEVGKLVEPRVMQAYFRKTLKACGIYDASFHTLRHTFATRCVELGFDIKCLSEILGHASVNITLNRYVHPSMDTKREQMNKLAALLPEQ